VIQLFIAAVGIVGLLALCVATLYVLGWLILVATSCLPLVGRRHSVPNARTSREPLKDSLSASRDRHVGLRTR
jgi:hypothetical protein